MEIKAKLWKEYWKERKKAAPLYSLLHRMAESRDKGAQAKRDQIEGNLKPLEKKFGKLEECLMCAWVRYAHDTPPCDKCC